ncbi:hypothetical protein PT974_07227 [Cladobotryum mycophilum]|uniref:MARVEL domain-containing protein n=1 Tax=Cladobotryum mycophilum TaxID=491253 RepID=A0ABR0SNQ1_9HYPO
MFGDRSHGLMRYLAFANHLLVFVSSTIVVGILSFFIHELPNRGAHVVYQEVIAVLTMVLWLFGMGLPLWKGYRGHLLPLSLIFSYLWLTSFIFASQSWSGNRCRNNGPGFGRCSLKHTSQAFTFLTFFFLFCNVIIESLLTRSEPTTQHVTKERPGSDVSGVTA